ncbi:DUF1820 family protein [Catenovulum sp. SM1970]|uniref:DUF1820 family protein n=1 Tax=Marinifaba aquimaris TaxID=2741323 RepID=UPI0015738AC6|nr:DUF1820 family protein [Marinifaba aquimaris]NTS78183.1 DUF1820 family protein [Marinifaba aquimaris]
MSKNNSPLYKVQFVCKGEQYEVYVREVVQSELYGFIEIADFVWDSQSSFVVDTSEEKLKAEFDNVERTYIPMHHLLRIDAVKEKGTAKISALTDKVASFPTSPFIQPKK